MAMMKQSNTGKVQMKKDGTKRVLKDSPQDDKQIYKREDMGLNMGVGNRGNRDMKKTPEKDMKKHEEMKIKEKKAKAKRK